MILKTLLFSAGLTLAAFLLGKLIIKIIERVDKNVSNSNKTC